MQRHDSTANPVVTKYLANPNVFGLVDLKGLMDTTSHIPRLWLQLRCEMDVWVTQLMKGGAPHHHYGIISWAVRDAGRYSQKL